MLEEIRKKLAEVIDFDNRKMFGANAFQVNRIVFGMVKDDVFYLRSNDEDCEKYIKAGMTNFNPRNKGKGMPYWVVPQVVIDDKAKLSLWVSEALAIAIAAKKMK